MNEAHDFWTARLSDLLDGDLSPREAEAVEEHLAACSACSRTRDELAEIRRRARALAGAEPEFDLWPGIQARLGEDPLADKVIPLDGRQRRAVTDPARGLIRFSFPQAAAAALVLLGGGWLAGVALAGGEGSGAIPGRETAILGNDTPVSPAALAAVPTGLSDEVAALERTLLARAGALEPETRATLLRSLEVIDRAIRESLEALSLDPGSEYLQGHLGSALERKRGYLRQMVQLLEV